MTELFYEEYTLSTAIIISVTLSLLYVGLIYVNTDINTDRNDPMVVRQRIFRVTGLTMVIIAILPPVLSRLSGVPVDKIYSEFGFFGGLRFKYHELHFEIENLNLVIRDILQTLVLISILYVGPLTDKLFFEDGPSILSELINDLKTIHGIRDLIIGPVTEEIIYTAAIIVTLNHVPNVSKSLLIFLPPVFFSFAHFHHAFQLYMMKISFNYIIISTVFQLTYTFLFGIFTNFILLRTDNLYAVILSHSFCNFFGVPKFTVNTNKFKYWNYAYYGLLFLGIYFFQANLFALSESSLALVHWT